MVDIQGDLFEPWGQLETIDEGDALGFFDDESQAEDPTAPPVDPPPPLRPYQENGLVALQEAEVKPVQRPLVVVATGGGKALRTSEPVLTALGWRPIGEIKVRDKVFASDGRLYEVTGVFPQGRKQMYRVTFTDETTVDCDGEHLWFARNRYAKYRNQDYRVFSTLQLAKPKQKNYWQVPTSLPLLHETTIKPKLNPYLLGALLGDGHIVNSTSISNQDEELLQDIARILPAGITLKRNAGSKCDYSITGPRGAINPISESLRELGLFGLRSYEKFIPEECYRYSVADRLSLLQGLMDTDGTIHCRSGEFNTTSNKLANGVVELVRSLGGVTKLRLRSHSTYTHGGLKKIGRPSYRIYVRLTKGLNPFRISRKASRYAVSTRTEFFKAIAAIDKVDIAEAVCIAVDSPDSSYLTTNYTITHNTKIAAEHVARCTHRERVLFLAHRDELITQAARTLRWNNPTRKLGIEQADSVASQSDDIVVASIQTLVRSGLRRLKKFKPFDLVIVDEVHHAVAKSYRKILAHCLESNPSVMITGWTATVRRGDNVPLSRVMDEIVFERSIFDLWSDAEEGPYLCPLTGKRITTDVDISNVHVRAGEFAKDEIAKAVNIDSRNSKIISAVEDHALAIGKKSIVIYAADVAHAEALAEQCNDRGINANVVLGKTPKLERFKIFRDFADGKFPVLVNVGVCTEGWDCPRVDCIVPARPILSPLLWEQIQGRGLRLFPGKSDCLLLDPVDNCGKHQRMSLGAAFGIRDIDFLGQDVNKLVTRVKAAARLMGVQVQDGDTADDINRKLDTIKGLARGTIYVKTQAQLVDVFNATATAPEVQSDSNFPWIKSGEAEYCLPFNFKDTGQSCVVVLYKDGLGLWHTTNSYNGRIKSQKVPTKTIPFKWADQFVRGQFDYPMWKAKLRTAKWKSQPATDRQKGALQGLGISTATLPSNFTGGDASDLIESIKWLRTWKTRRSEIMQTTGSQMVTLTPTTAQSA